MSVRTRLRAAGLAILVAGLAVHSPMPADAQDVRLTAPGASDDLTERLRAASLLFRDPEEGTTRTGADILAAARADYGRLIGVLYEEGFFAPVIEIRLDGRDAAGISPFSAPASVDTVVIEVETGEPFRLGEAAIAPLATGTDLPEDFRSGARATTPLLRATTEAALRGWRAEGYATAEVEDQRIIARNRAAVLDVAISLDPGPVITFGNLIPEGYDHMRRERIIEIAGLPTGEVYSPEALERAEARLREAGVFSAVALRLRDPRAGDVADVSALVDEAPLRRLGFGAELSSEEGLELTAYWLHRNLFGGAERIRVDLVISDINNDVEGTDVVATARFERPATFTPDTTLSLEFEAAYLDERFFEIEGLSFEALLTHRLSERLTVEGGIGVSYTRFTTGGPWQEITLLRLPLGATYDGRDDPLDARSGVYAEARLAPFVTDAADTGVRLTFDGRTYRAFGEAERTRIAGRLQLGTLAGGDVTTIPPDDLFYSGGSGTVRGQPYQSLGVVQGGVTRGGRSFAGLSGEIRHDIGDTNFGIVGFADAGAVAEDAWGEGSSDWHAGAGFGIRYDTPFGPIRVDVATPVTGDQAGEEAYLYIGIGQAF